MPTPAPAPAPAPCAGVLLAQMHASPDNLTKMAQLQAILATQELQPRMALATPKLLELLGGWLKKCEAGGQVTLLRLMLRALGHVPWPPAVISGSHVAAAVTRLTKHSEARLQHDAAGLLYRWLQAGAALPVKPGTLTMAAIKAAGRQQQEAAAAAAASAGGARAAAQPQPQPQPQRGGGAAAAAPAADKARPAAPPRPWIGTVAGAAAAAGGAAPARAAAHSSRPITGDQALRKRPAGAPRDAVSAALAMDGPAAKRARLRPALRPDAQRQLEAQRAAAAAAQQQAAAAQAAAAQMNLLAFLRALGPAEARRWLQGQVDNGTAMAQQQRLMMLVKRHKQRAAEQAEAAAVRQLQASGQAGAGLALLPWHPPPAPTITGSPVVLASTEAERLAAAAAQPASAAAGGSPASPPHEALAPQEQAAAEAGLELIPLEPADPGEAEEALLQALEAGLKLRQFVDVDRAVAALFPPAAQQQQQPAQQPAVPPMPGYAAQAPLQPQQYAAPPLAQYPTVPAAVPVTQQYAAPGYAAQPAQYYQPQQPQQQQYYQPAPQQQPGSAYGAAPQAYQQPFVYRQ